MKIQCVAEHSIDIDLLNKGVCFDIGCRGFLFSTAIRDMGLQVVAFDLEPMEAPPGITFLPYAVSNFDGDGFYNDTADQQAKHLSTTGIRVPVIDINSLFANIADKAEHVDVLKLDAEGTEYLILSDPRFLPVPKQISVEFHEHCHKDLHDKYFDACVENLLKHYVAVKHDRTQAYGAGWNYWDSLFIKKDLL